MIVPVFDKTHERFKILLTQQGKADLQRLGSGLQFLLNRTPLNEWQVQLLNRLLDDFEGKLTSSKWASIAKCSPDTALRDITLLLELGVLKKSPGGGRSTSYELTNG